ncbi:DEKNAAC104241 [Brettanomyces naardenensis]|uniref:Mitochondrial fission 1 protein n=1 Tax=Brettanomyces naardenensis TaxID=13370 RepID=A0A448YPZ8_BRENA|nr:DEKNAAC104241 [Brettanomyces naardenensis]
MPKFSYLPNLDDAFTPLTEPQLVILEKQVDSEQPEPTTQSLFNFAWGLVKSESQADNKQGIDILTSIFKKEPSRRRECLYYLSVGCYKIGEYKESERYVKVLLQHEPDNLQAQALKQEIDNGLAKNSLIGFAIISGVTAAGVGLASLLLRQRKK